MKIGVVGGKLQGAEIVYLAKKAGFETLLIDRVPDPPACGLCDRFVHADCGEESQSRKHLENCDMILPAFENREDLAFLDRICRESRVPFAFDGNAYGFAHSKRLSDRLFADLALPRPAQWPECEFPVLIKPDCGSGSEGVELLESPDDIERRFPNRFPPADSIAQQFLAGPSYSIEVIGAQGRYRTFPITKLEMDEAFDCKRVTAPAAVSADCEREFETLARKIANALRLKGIMDVEAILHNDRLKVLEIDARFPSQTPMAVYASSGINMVRELFGLFTTGKLLDSPDAGKCRHAIVEHVKVSRNTIRYEGEHIMGENGPLRSEKRFFGADEALTNYREGGREWVATLILTGNTACEAAAKRDKVAKTIAERFGLARIEESDRAEIGKGLP